MHSKKQPPIKFGAKTLEAQKRAIAAYRKWPRMSHQEALELIQLPDEVRSDQCVLKRFMSRQPAFSTGSKLPWDVLLKDIDGPRPLSGGPGAFGGFVYALAALSASRVVEQEEKDVPLEKRSTKGKPGIHSIQGVFCNPALTDRPLIFSVSTLQVGRSFSTRHVEVQQPQAPSDPPSGPFQEADANQPLNGVCFTCTTTFKRPIRGADELQAHASAQQRYGHILSQRQPNEWEPSPQSDIDLVTALFPGAGPGSFPVLDMYKVDMKEFNKDKDLKDLRELHYYRPLSPIPKDDVNAHIVSHAYGADKNSLVMLGNLLGYGWNLGAAASLSYSFYVHTNGEDAIMSDNGWWLSEGSWSRVSAGRAMMEIKIWSPEGKHVATGYMEGLVSPAKEPSKLKL